MSYNTPGKILSTMNRKSGILVIVHSVPPMKLIPRRTSFSQSDPMDNLLRLHSIDWRGDWHRLAQARHRSVQERLGAGIDWRRIGLARDN